MTNGISFNFEDNVGLSFSKIEYPKAFESKASVPAKFGTAEDTQREFGGNSVYIHAISPSARVDQLDVHITPGQAPGIGENRKVLSIPCEYPKV